MENNLFSKKAIYRYTFIMIIIILLVYGTESALYARKDAEQTCRSTLNAAKSQIEYRVEQSINLLTALARQEQYADPAESYMDKVLSLESINESMGYMQIRYVDSEIYVYSQRGKTSLASREYMQKLFTTGEVQVTDSFAAGSDGVTLNYTVAVPMYYNDKISGCLFCAIYFDEVQNLLHAAVRQDGIEAAVLGSKNQMMSATDTLHYGESYLDYMQDANIWGNTRDQIEEELFAKNAGEGSFWTTRMMNIEYSTYSYIESTDWSIIVTVNYWSIFLGKIMEGLWAIVVSLVLIIITSCVLGYYVPAQRARMQALVESVRNLERRLYLGEQAESHDFSTVLQLTSEGLSDSLTGVVTRSVFVNQIQGYMDKLSGGSTAAMCFIDLDDLKKINDEYGHRAGDVALKEIGFILREYEKKYDGIVGRYGGDEFALFVSGFRDVEEVDTVMEELCQRLNFQMPEFGSEVTAHCSIGVALWNENLTYEQLINQADHALYQVKHRKKGTYEIYKDGDVK